MTFLGKINFMLLQSAAGLKIAAVKAVNCIDYRYKRHITSCFRLKGCQLTGNICYFYYVFIGYNPDDIKNKN